MLGLLLRIENSRQDADCRCAVAALMRSERRGLSDIVTRSTKP
jgi:hypothetical protein